MLVTQNVKVGKEDLCNKLEAPTEKLYLSGGMLTPRKKKGDDSA